MSDKVDAIIKFNLDNLKGVQECDTNEEQPKANYYKKIQETEEGQSLIQELANVINNIGNIDGFTNALRQYITKYALLKDKNPNITFKIRDVEFDYNDNKRCTLQEIIISSFSNENGLNNNNDLINLYNGIIDQFDRVCEDLDEVFNITYNLNNFENFMNSLSLETISPLTIELCYSIINKHISKKAQEIVCTTPEETNRLNACKNKFTNLQNGTQVVRKELRQLSNESEDSAFKKCNGNFKKDDNYLPLVKDEYNRNYLHYAWKHFKDVSAKNKTLENIKVRLLQYAGNNKENITQACTEKDVYGLTPLCYVLINAFDDGITTGTVKTELSDILKYFEGLDVSIQLNQEELQAIYDYFQITKNAQGQQRDYREFIKTMSDYIQQTLNKKIPYVQKSKIYKPQIKYKAQTNKEQMQSNNLSIETFLSDDGGYKDKVGDFVDSLFKEMFNNNHNNEFNKYFIGTDTGYKDFNGFKDTYNIINYNNKIISIINNIKQDEKLKYIQGSSTHNNTSRSNYCSSLFIKAIEQKYTENNNPDIMFKFLSDFCEKDMGIKINQNDYIQIIKYFLNDPDKITDDVQQNIKSLTRYMIKNKIVVNNDFQISTKNKNTFIQQITTKDNDGSFGPEEQGLIQDIILTAIDNNINFGNTTKDLVSQLSNNGSGGTSNILVKNQQNLSIFTIVKNLILSGNVKETEVFSQYSGLTDEETTQLKQILAKTLAITKIIEGGKEDCSKLKDAVVKFVSGNIGLTIEDIAQIKVEHKSISKFCKEKAFTNKKCAYYSWFLNKLVVNNYIANNHSGNTIERSGSREQLLQPDAKDDILPKNIVLDTYDEFEPGNGQQTTTPTNIIIDTYEEIEPGNGQQTTTSTNIIMDTYKEFEKYKNNTVKKTKLSIPHKVFQVSYMNSDTNTVTGKRSKIHYQDIKSVYDYEQQFDNSDYNSETSRTLKNIVSDINKNDIHNDLKKYKLQQQVALNQEKTDQFKRFCTVFNLIRANSLLFNAIKGINKQNSTQKQK